MPIRLNDDHCLLWIKDPSISPFENNYVHRINRKDILSEETLKNPKSFLNNIKRKCFYNSALRPKIIEKIKEYQRPGTMRLHTLNDKLSDDIEYITPQFTEDECKQWANNHTINPRTNLKIPISGKVYIELLYTAIQYGLPTPSILDTEPTNKYDKTLFKVANRIIKSVLHRLEFMKQNDEYFLNHDVESFDRKLKIESPTTPGRRAARVAAVAAAKPNNTFDISTSSSSYKSMNSAERRQLRDIELEKKEEKNLVAEHKYKKGQLPKKEVNKTIFTAFRKFLDDLQADVMKEELIKNILKDANEGDKARLIDRVHSYINRINHNSSFIQTILKEKDLDTVEGIIRNFINNIYAQLLDPLFIYSRDMEIVCLTYINRIREYRNIELIKGITKVLFAYIVDKHSFVGDTYIYKYFRYIVDDIIPRDFVSKREIDVRVIAGTHMYINSNYQNYYYKVLIPASEEQKRVRLPEGMGLLIGKELTKAIYDLEEPYFNTYPEDRVITDDNPLNGFTYEECKDWVMIPIINPRTFKKILIDSPIYNRLLCMSYQYDTNLIPRMITSRGYKILEALEEVINDILKNERKMPQSRIQLEEFIKEKEEQFTKEKRKKDLVSNPNNVIGLKWKNIGIKQPKAGIEIINKKLIEAFAKSKSPDSVLPFYVFFSEEEFAKFGITDITKKSYVNIATYYVPVDDRRSRSTRRARSRQSMQGVQGEPTNKIGLKWKKVNIEAIKGVEIKNKKLTDVFLKSKSSDGKLPSNILFTEEDLAKLDITTIAKKSYIKVPNYYAPVVEKRASDSYIKPKSNIDAVISKRHSAYSIHNYYTVGDCLRWAQQPNRDPKQPDKIFETDGKEYNVIFEQALLHDYNIIPINITSKGIKFRNLIFKTKSKFLTIAKYSKLPTSRNATISVINTKVCNAIKLIYDDESNEEGKKYKKFKDKMIEKCEQYNKKPAMCIEYIKGKIEDYFNPDETHAMQYTINYYQESALASLLIKYDAIKGKLYNEELRDIFIHDFNKFYVYIYEIDDELNEYQKDAIDAGGPKREFFTKLFEELFCDNKHHTRPFICPPGIIGGKYYINPNFEPDENFRKVINAYAKNNKTGITKFTTERDYEYIYYVIGKLLCLTVYNEMIGLPKQLSNYILNGLINQPNELDYYDLLYFYLKEFENTVPLINMISSSQIDYIEAADLSFNDLYAISKTGGADGVKITKENYIKFLQQQANHIITKNFLGKGEVNSGKNMKKRYASLFAGFSNEMRKFFYREKVSIEQVSLLITNVQLTQAILREFANKIILKIEVSTSGDENDVEYRMTQEEKRERETEMKGYITNIIIQPRQGVSVKDHYEFIKDLLRFWSALNYYNKNAEYKIFYKYGWNINVENLPGAHTCFNILDIFGFPADTPDKIYTPAMKEEFIYKKLLLAVGEQEMELQ
jgi:hypothetical protein